MKLFTHVASFMLFALPLFAFAQTTPLRILEKLKPELPKNYGMLDVKGVVRLRIEFLANGMVGKVVVISGLTKELGQLAAEAAKKIRFEPKMENGVKVTSFRVIEYSYSWRTCGWGCSDKAKTSPTPKPTAQFKGFRDSRYGRECIEARDAAGADELSDEWEVYQALMKEEGLSESQILIIDDSLSFSFSTDEPIIPEASSATNQDYREKNRTGYLLSCLFASKGASFITKKEIQTFGEGNFWRSFRLSHPLSFGLLSLSRVGFNSDRTEAIVDFDFSCGGLCGHSSVWKFTKIDGKWQKTGSGGFDIYS